MPKIVNVFKCSSCLFIASKWQGQCRSCGTWNSFQEENKENIKKEVRKKIKLKKAKSLNEIKPNIKAKIKTGLSEFDRVVGNGITPGSLVLVGGEPGVGKSTLLTAVMDKLTHNNYIYSIY